MALSTDPGYRRVFRNVKRKRSNLSEGLRPSDSPTGSLAGPLRPTPLARLTRYARSRDYGWGTGSATIVRDGRPVSHCGIPPLDVFSVVFVLRGRHRVEACPGHIDCPATLDDIGANERSE